MELDSFRLEEYNQKDLTHRTVAIELANDVNGNYCFDIDYQVSELKKYKPPHNKAYIVYYLDIAVGYISLVHKEDRYEVSYSIVPKYRGHHLATILLKEFSNKVFEIYSEIDKITLLISRFNTPSKKTALAAGYKKENSARYTLVNPNKINHKTAQK